jgi:hypothetical protein
MTAMTKEQILDAEKQLTFIDRGFPGIEIANHLRLAIKEIKRLQAAEQRLRTFHQAFPKRLVDTDILLATYDGSFEPA